MSEEALPPGSGAPVTAAAREALAWCERGRVLLDRRDAAAAHAAFATALRLGLDPEIAAGERWQAAMLAGDFESAWIESDRVLAARSARGERCDGRPYHLRWVWDGTPLVGRDVLVRCYHGLGDTLQFVRYAPLLKASGARVTVEAQPELIPLLGTAPGIDALVPLGDAPECDVAIESTELPHAFRTTLATIPAAMPYLGAAASRLPHSELNVGIVWESGRWAPHRSLPLPLVAPLVEIPGLALHSLQRGPAWDELAPGEAAIFRNPGDRSAEPLDTAALVAGLDLVISTDTMVAHLAGALGRPVWTLLAFHADWRWLTGRDDSPWYPTMRLFRQPEPGAWEPVVGTVAAALRERAAAAALSRDRLPAAPPDDRRSRPGACRRSG